MSKYDFGAMRVDPDWLADVLTRAMNREPVTFSAKQALEWARIDDSPSNEPETDDVVTEDK